jgi:hypothetical protein
MDDEVNPTEQHCTSCVSQAEQRQRHCAYACSVRKSHYSRLQINTCMAYCFLQGDALLPGEANPTFGQRMQRFFATASGYWLRDYSNIEVHQERKRAAVRLFLALLGISIVVSGGVWVLSSGRQVREVQVGDERAHTCDVPDCQIH